MKDNRGSWYFLYKHIIKGMNCVFVLAIFLGALAKLISQITGVEIIRTVTRCILTNDRERLYVSAALFIISTVFCMTFKVLHKIILFRVKQFAICRLEDELVSAYSNLKTWGHRIPPGEIASIIKQNVTQVVTAFLENIISLSLVVISIIGVSAYALSINPASLMICFITAGGLVFFARKSIVNLQGLQVDYSQAFDKLYSKSWEYIKNMEIIPYLNKNRVFKYYYESVGEISDFQIKFNRAKSYSYLFNRFGSIGIVLLVSLFGTYLVANNKILISDILALILVLPVISEAFFEIPSSVANFKVLDGMKIKLETILDLAGYDRIGKSEIKLPENYKLDVNITTFSFQDGGKELFHQMQFNVLNGLFICTAGPSGSGKSTLLRIIAGLQPIKAGKILINGINTKEIQRNELWDKIGYIQQEAIIINDTICNNIVLYNNVDYEKLSVSIQMAQLSQTIYSLHEGVQTMVNRSSLSSGECQKINLARVFYRNSDIYLLDEATSHIDPEAEAKIVSCLKALALNQRKLILFVTHNRAILEQSDYVLALMSPDKISLSNHYQLMNKNKEYWQMVNKEKEIRT